MKAGILLAATPLLDGSIFEKALIYITEHNSNGAMGFVVNKPFHRNLNELEEFNHSISFPLYEGGPVDQEHLFFLHQRPDLVEAGTPVNDGIYIGGDFKTAVACINNKSLTKEDIKIFIGYCGWDAHELEAEIEEGSWIIQPHTSIF